MANTRQYAYYLEGNEIAIVEKDVSFDNDVDSKDYGPGASKQRWESPQETIADGLKIKYVYTPTYRIQTTNDVDRNITQYMSTDGKLTIADNSSTYIIYATTYALAADKYIVLKKAGRFNGLHKIESIGNNTGTNNKIILTTKYTGSESTWTDFEETPSLFYALDVLEDESFEFDLPNSLVNKHEAELKQQYASFKQANDDVDEKIKDIAIKRVKLNIIYIKLAKEIKTNISDQEAIDFCNDQSPAFRQFYGEKLKKDKSTTLLDVKNKMVENSIVEYVIEKSNVETLNTSFSEIMDD